MHKNNIYHFGLPFFDTVLNDFNFSIIPPTEKILFKKTIGGICNTIKLANNLNINTNLIISKKDSPIIMNQLSSLKNIKLYIDNSIKTHEAIVFDSPSINKRKSLVAALSQNISKVSINNITSGKLIISYIENFPASIDSFCSKDVCIFTDFNDSIDLSLQSESFLKQIKRNLLRINYFLFSGDEIDKVKNFINALNLSHKDLERLDKITFISHEPKIFRLYNISLSERKWNFILLKTIKNKYYLDSVKTSLGNGDIFLLLFSYYHDNKRNIINTIHSVSLELSKIIKPGDLNN